MVCKLLFCSSERTFKLEQEPISTKPCMYHFRTLGTGGFSLCLVQDGERVGPPHCTHNLERERGSSSSLLSLCLPVCLSCLYPATPSSFILHSCLLNALDFGTSLHPKSSSSAAEKPHPRFGSGIRSIHLQELSSSGLSVNFPRGGNESQVACLS